MLSAIVERGAIGRLSEHLPAKAGKVFVVTTADVWQARGRRAGSSLGPHEILDLPGGEDQKRLAPVEALAERNGAAAAPTAPAW